jgi:hypothetical protein
MKPHRFFVLLQLSVAVLVIGCTQAVGPNTFTFNTPREETHCIGPGSITGTVVDATTIVTPRFSAYECWANFPVRITVQFKGPAPGMKVGDTVRLKGRLDAVQDPRRGFYGFVLKDAEIA